MLRVLLGNQPLATFHGNAACRRHIFVKDVSRELLPVINEVTDLSLRLDTNEPFELDELRLLVSSGYGAG